MDRNYKALELDKILNMLSMHTACEDSKSLAMELLPAKTVEHAKLLLEETDGAYVLSAKFGAPSFYGLKSAVNALRRANAGGVLSLVDLIRVDTNLKNIRGVKEWRSKSAGISTALDYRFDALSPNKYLEERINSTVANEEEVADTASPALADIRRKIRVQSLKIKDQLDKIIRSSTYQKYLQENLVTQRDGRYVIPVKQEHRGDVAGLIHDSSASGATLFIEPMAVVDANNEIRVLQSKEKDEIERILTVLSLEIGEFAETIIESYNMLVEINLIFAKSELAYKMKAVKPIIEKDGKIKLTSARHPLIDKNSVVPTNIELGYTFDSLIITGPNTGGKTVSIKTLGLFCLMAACGLMIPCAEGSKVAFFDKVLVDIGDEQSIEQSLSTFSSHMKNIINILDRCDENSLVLVDELGAGTDPIEGAALATAIIEDIRSKGAKLASTTHYAELKEYALKTTGVENGACEFDVKTLSPTYKLLIGVPGKSNAFAISKTLGMNEYLVERAKQLVSVDSNRFESVISKLEDSRRKMEDEKNEAKKQRDEAEKALKHAEELRLRAERSAQSELDRAKYEASQMVAKTRAHAEALITELEEIKKKKNKELSLEDKARLKSGIRKLENQADPIHDITDSDYKLPRELKVGDDVLISDINKNAVVLEINGNQIMVQAGIIKTKVDIKKLRLITEKPKQKVKQQSMYRTVTKSLKQQPVSMDVDIRGQTCDEGIMNVDNFIDRALRQNLSTITIIHGKGTGVLRNAIQAHLKRHPSIKSYRFGTFGEGEMGVTIAELK